MATEGVPVPRSNVLLPAYAPLTSRRMAKHVYPRTRLPAPPATTVITLPPMINVMGPGLVSARISTALRLRCAPPPSHPMGRAVLPHMHRQVQHVMTAMKPPKMISVTVMVSALELRFSAQHPAAASWPTIPMGRAAFLSLQLQAPAVMTRIMGRKTTSVLPTANVSVRRTAAPLAIFAPRATHKMASVVSRISHPRAPNAVAPPLSVNNRRPVMVLAPVCQKLT